MAQSQNEAEEAPRFLLLLPPLPSAGDSEVLSSIYGNTIRDVLKEATQASADYQAAPVLDIALAFEEGNRTGTSIERCEHAQKYVARAYGLVCTIAANGSYNIEDKDGVDVNVILVSWAEEGSRSPPAKGLVISLQRLASSLRWWQYAFGVEDATGTAMVSAFVQAKQQDSHSHHEHHSRASQHSARTNERPPAAINGGTFDHLHIGHKLLLTMTVFAAVDQDPASPTSTVIFGITGDELLKNKKHAEHLESWAERQAAVVSFVRGIIDFDDSDPITTHINDAGVNGHAVHTQLSNGLLIRCVEISDPFGPTITERDIDTLVVSGETRSGGKAVNDKRVAQGWPALAVLEVDVLSASEAGAGGEDFDDKISSTAIRKRLSEKGAAKM